MPFILELPVVFPAPSDWTPGTKPAVSTYDAADNLTNISYAVSPRISIAFDALNRPTNMVDAAGTCRYTYTSFGVLASEDGPWDNDTVTYAYSNQLRSGLTLAQPNASDWRLTYGYDGA